jgi:two-component system sensor histidine kinase UhpB
VWSGTQNIGTLVVTPEPAYEVEEIWRITRGLMGLLLALFVAVNALVYWVVGRALRPIDKILQALTSMERGDLGIRLPRFQLPELSRIGNSFNRMGEALEESTHQNHRLTRQLITVQEEERKSLARELHDELGQCLSAVQANAKAIVNISSGAGDPVRGGAEAILEVTRHVMGVIRTMLQRLLPQTLHDLGLAEALEELVGAWKQRNPEVACSLRVTGDVTGLDSATSTAIYRIVQESLTNVSRHAGARKVSVSIEPARGATGNLGREASDHLGVPGIEIRVEDDGAGMDLRSAHPGFGLMGMRERAEMLGGNLEVVTAPGEGTRIRTTIPAHALQAA